MFVSFKTNNNCNYIVIINEVKMKKINKTLLLASTLFVSSVGCLADSAFADEGYNLDVEPSPITYHDYNLEDALTEVNTDTLEAEASDIETSELPQDTTTEELPQDNTTDKASEDIIDSQVSAEIESADIVKYDDRNLDDIFKLLDEEEGEEELEVESGAEITEEKPVEAIEETVIKEEVYYAPKGTGVMVNEGGNLKYYEDNKLVKNDKVIVDGKFYNIDETGKATNPKAIWGNIGSDIYYITDAGYIAKGIHEIKAKKYYFNNDGILQTNRRLVTGESYYDVNAAGEMIAPRNKWIDLNKKTYYNDKDGKLSKGIVTIDGKAYYFDTDGVLTANKKIVTDTKYYVVDDKAMVTNPKNLWFNMGGNVYRTDENGNLMKGLRKIDNKDYLFNSDGKMYKDQKVINSGKFYEIDKEGLVTNPKNSWVELNGQRYHTNEAGYVKEGVWKIDNEYYYFTSNGLTPNQVVTQKGVLYTVDANGIATKQDNNVPGEKSIDKVMEWMFNARTLGLTYNMGAGRTSATQADCSSAVYRALIYGGFLEPTSWVGNTETLFQMGAKGTIMYEIQENEIQHGDIFVSGRPGASAGAAGHTGFILNPIEDTIIHMSSGSNGVAVTPRKGYMGDGRGLPVKYYRLVGANSANIYMNNK